MTNEERQVIVEAKKLPKKKKELNKSPITFNPKDLGKGSDSQSTEAVPNMVISGGPY
jgi:hypothetical protein